MHHIKPGAANQSYGLQVAELAGVPQTVLACAREKLSSLKISDSNNSQESPRALTQAPPVQATLFDEPNPILEKLTAIDPDELTPKQAHTLLYELKSLQKNIN